MPRCRISSWWPSSAQNLGASRNAPVIPAGRYTVTTGLPINLEGEIEDRSYVRAATRRIVDEIVNLTQTSAVRIRTAAEPGAGGGELVSGAR
jgi:hypothetical protein